MAVRGGGLGLSSTVTVIFLLTMAVPDSAARIFSAMADPLLVGRLSTGVVLLAVSRPSLDAALAGAGADGEVAGARDAAGAGAAVAGSAAQALAPSASPTARHMVRRAGRGEGEAGNGLMPPYRPKACAT